MGRTAVANIWLLLTQEWQRHKPGPHRKGVLGRTRRWAGTHLLLVVIFDSIFVAFLQPANAKPTSVVHQIWVHVSDLKQRGAPRTPPRECRFLSDGRVHTRYGGFHRRTVANPGRVSSIHPPRISELLPSTQLGRRGSQRSIAFGFSLRSPQLRGSVRSVAHILSSTRSARPLPGDGATGTRG